MFYPLGRITGAVCVKKFGLFTTVYISMPKIGQEKSRKSFWKSGESSFCVCMRYPDVSFVSVFITVAVSFAEALQFGSNLSRHFCCRIHSHSMYGTIVLSLMRFYFRFSTD